MNTRRNSKASGNSVLSSTWNSLFAARFSFTQLILWLVCGAILVGGAFVAQYAELGAQSGKSPMLHPMRAPVYISGSFGEYRNYGRFHYGVDYKTFNRNGLDVLMPADGVVRRMQVSEKGYGNALFIASGASMFTFAHLQDFLGVIPELEYLRSALDYLRPGARMNLSIPGWFRFRRGQVVARSGESGSGAPHLHFEIRRGGRYYNALSFAGLEIRDRTAPVLRHIYVEMAGNVSRLPVRPAGGGVQRTDVPKNNQGPAGEKRRTVIQPYTLGTPSGPPANEDARILDLKTNSVIVPRNAKVRLRIGTYDTMVAQNRNGVQNLSVRGDGKLVFERNLNRIRLGDLGRADKTYDTVRTIIGREYVYLLFHAANSGPGLFRAPPAGNNSASVASSRKISVQVGDGSGNRAVLEFNLVFKDRTGVSAKGDKPAPGRNPGVEDAFVSVGPGGKRKVSAASGRAKLTLDFSAGTLHLPAQVRIEALAVPPQEKNRNTPSGAAPERPAFDVAGPAFDVRARNLYYRRFARGRAEFPAKKELPVGLFGFHAASGKYRLVALPYKRVKGIAYYRFTYRMTGPLAQLVDRSPPRISNRFRWAGPPDENKSPVLVREFAFADRGTGVSKRRTRVLFDGNHFPFRFIRDRSTLRIEIPRSMIPARGALLAVRTGDFADNKSDWLFDFLSAGSR